MELQLFEFLVFTVTRIHGEINGQERRLIHKFHSLGYYCSRNLFFVRTTGQISLGILVSVSNLKICKENLTKVAVQIEPDFFKNLQDLGRI